MGFRFKYCDQPLPYPPGTSPFHIKGEFYRQTAAAVAHHDQRSKGVVTRILEREGLRDFASQSFLSSAWYDVLPMPRIIMAVSEARGRDVHELTSDMGRAAVDAQMTGVYARVLQGLTPDRFCQRFDQVISHFYDFAPVQATPVPGGARVVRSGMPLPVAEWWTLVTVPFVVVPLTANGARDVEVDWRIEMTGMQRGVDMCEVRWDVRWSAAP
jgi:hypothetical protein